MEQENGIRFGLQVNANFCDSCGLCIEACPDGALGFSGKTPVLMRECQACGACEEICPNGALALEFAIE